MVINDIPEAGEEWFKKAKLSMPCPRCGYSLYRLEGKWVHDPDAPDCPYIEPGRAAVTGG